ncbi:MAG TPA: hypothetical protein VHZ51_02770 [Ktedonobacteraceae bacterium]|nr:hypothetical protein [Ktedonobacteraceae bacterium]
MSNFNLGDLMGKLPGSQRAGGVSGDTVKAARGQVDGVINQAIDRLAGTVPGGEQYASQAKQAISGALNNLQQQLENEVSRRMGGGGQP